MSKTANLPPKQPVQREPDRVLTKTSAQLVKESADLEAKTLEDAISKRIERNLAFIEKLRSMETPPAYARSIL